MSNYKDTIRIIDTEGKYTFMVYQKGGITEYCIGKNYDPENKSWYRGSYFWNKGNAYACFAEICGSSYVKSDSQIINERDRGITWDRLCELATKFKDEIEWLNNEYAESMEFFDAECEMTDVEKSWFGICEVYEDEK